VKSLFQSVVIDVGIISDAPADLRAAAAAAGATRAPTAPCRPALELRRGLIHSRDTPNCARPVLRSVLRPPRGTSGVAVELDAKTEARCIGRHSTNPPMIHAARGALIGMIHCPCVRERLTVTSTNATRPSNPATVGAVNSRPNGNSSRNALDLNLAPPVPACAATTAPPCCRVRVGGLVSLRRRRRQ
jgi:hypothetical protein